MKTALGVGLTTLVLSACYGPIDTDKTPSSTGETGDSAPTTETAPE